MSSQLVLVVDQDERIRNLLHVTLEAHDYQCITVSNGDKAISLASLKEPDMILLDVALPDMDGTEVIKTIRSWSSVPILVISARDEDHDKVMALDAGADDYITKPFSVEELLARIRAVNRRYASLERGLKDSMFINGALTIDYQAGCVYLNNKELHVTPIEYRLLCMLSQNLGQVLTHGVMTQRIWGSSWKSNVMSLRTFMASLRKKLGDSENGKQYIQTHTGVGYRMVKMDD